MGLIPGRTLTGVLLSMAVVCPLAAAPKLRLVETTVGPVSVAQGSSAATRTVEAYNAGDGSLNLTLESSASWAVPSLGTARNCSTRSGSCIPILVALNTSSLAQGSTTAVLTVSDANALDAPQTITVTVAVGGPIPGSLTMYVAPNGSSSEYAFTTNSAVQPSAATESGGSWLSVAMSSVGSYAFPVSYKITAKHLSGAAEGSYRGSVTVRGSSVAADNKTVPVTLQVTSQPIAKASPSSLTLRYAQNIAKQRINIALSNLGLGTLSITGSTVAMASGTGWLSTEVYANYSLVQAVVDTSNLAPGSYQGTVSIATNAANGTISVPVALDVVAQALPRVRGQGVVNNATFETGEPMAPGGIAAVFGEQFSFKDAASVTELPLATNAGGVRVLVNEQPAPIYYVSYGQINFQIPYETPTGDVVVRVERDGQRSNPVSLSLVVSAPRLLKLGIGEYGIIVNQDGTFPIPPTAGVSSRRARPGDALVIYAIGLGQTTPVAASGGAAPSNPLAQIVPSFVVHFGTGFIGGTVPVNPLYVGLTPGFVGLYQINVVVPESTFLGDHIHLTLQRNELYSNTVELAIQ